MPIQYLNTDLDLKSAEDLRPLARALERSDMYALHVGLEDDKLWWAVLEANCMASTPNRHITAIFKAIDNFKSGPARFGTAAVFVNATSATSAVTSLGHSIKAFRAVAWSAWPKSASRCGLRCTHRSVRD